MPIKIAEIVNALICKLVSCTRQKYC